MRRDRALTALALLVAAVTVVTFLVGQGGALVGSWETAIELDDAQTVTLRYTFAPNGAYTCTLAALGQSPDSGAQVRGRYKALSHRLYLSEGLGYAVDTTVYDSYRLDGDTLTLLGSSTGDMNGFYPLVLTRVEE